MKPNKLFLIIPAAGSGARMQSQLVKQYLDLNGKPVLQQTLERLHKCADFDKIVVASSTDDEMLQRLITTLPIELQAKLSIVEGGKERVNSVLNAINSLADIAQDDDWIMVHDAVRPCVRAEDIHNLIEQVKDEMAGGILASPVRDTIKQANAEQYVNLTINRSSLWLAATPQLFRFAPLKLALKQILEESRVVTDEASAIEALGLSVKLVQGHADNIKITYPEDLFLASAFLQLQGDL